MRFSKEVPEEIAYITTFLDPDGRYASVRINGFTILSIDKDGAVILYPSYKEARVVANLSIADDGDIKLLAVKDQGGS